MFFIFFLPILVAYCEMYHLSYSFVFLSCLKAIPFLLIPCGISMALGTIFMIFAATLRKNAVFIVLLFIGLLGYGMSTFITLLSQSRNSSVGGAQAIINLISFFDNPNPVWLPSRWIADMISSYVAGEPDVFLLKSSLLWSTAFGAAAVGFLVFDSFHMRVRSYAYSYGRTAEEDADNAKESPLYSLLDSWYSLLPISPSLRAIIVKDLISLTRDKVQSLQLLIYLGVGGVYLLVISFMSTALSLDGIALQLWWVVLSILNLVFSGFVLAAIITRLVYPSISLEGKGFWVLSVGPVSISQVVRAKYWCWLPLTIVIYNLLTISGLFAINASWQVRLLTVCFSTIIAVGTSALGLAMGALFAKFEWESANQITAGAGTLILLSACLVLILISTIPASVLLLITLVPAVVARIGYTYAVILFFLSWFFILIINTLVVYYSNRYAVRALERQIA